MLIIFTSGQMSEQPLCLLLPHSYADLSPELLKIPTQWKASHGERISSREGNKASAEEMRDGTKQNSINW